MTTKFIFNETVNIRDSCQNNVNVNNECFTIKCPKYNVMESSEISKVLRELTQCVASERDLLVPNNQDSVWDGSCAHNNVSESVPRNDISCSEISGSTTTNCSMDLSHEKRDDQSHICDDCGKHFTKKDFLQKHRIVHEEPRHRCNVCEKSFVREDKLKRHFVSIHSKQRPHICSICAKAFARKDKLKDHQKHHLTVSNNFLCFDCRIPFVQKSDLNRHTRNAHKIDDCDHNVTHCVTQSNTTTGSQVTNVTSVSMPSGLLPVLTIHSQNLLQSTVVCKTRKPRPKRTTRPQKCPVTSSTAGVSEINKTSSIVATMPVPAISGQILYPHMPIVTPLSAFPGNYTGLYPCTATSSASSLGSLHPPSSSSHDLKTPLIPYVARPPPPQYSSPHHHHQHHYNQYPPMEPMISTVFSLTAPPPPSSSSPSQSLSSLNDHQHSHLRPHTTGMVLAHNNLCQMPPPSPLTYYPYLHHRPLSTIGHYDIATPLTANIYPYLPF